MLQNSVAFYHNNYPKFSQRTTLIVIRLDVLTTCFMCAKVLSKLIICLLCLDVICLSWAAVNTFGVVCIHCLLLTGQKFRVCKISVYIA